MSISVADPLSEYYMIGALEDHSPGCLDTLRHDINQLHHDNPLRNKLRMIVAIKEMRPLDAIAVIEEGPVHEQDDWEVSVLLNCVFEVMEAVNELKLDAQETMPALEPEIVLPEDIKNENRSVSPTESQCSPEWSGLTRPEATRQTQVGDFLTVRTPCHNTPFKRFSPEEFIYLEGCFDRLEGKLNIYDNWFIAQKLETSEKRVKIWFKNKRARVAREEQLVEKQSLPEDSDNEDASDGSQSPLSM